MGGLWVLAWGIGDQLATLRELFKPQVAKNGHFLEICVSIYLAWQIWLHCAPQPGSSLRGGLWPPLPSGALGGP